MNWIMCIGFIAAACTTVSTLPQVLKIIKTKDTRAISLGMYVLLSVGVFLWTIYGVLIADLPMIIANGITLVLTSTVLFFKIKEKS